MNTQSNAVPESFDSQGIAPAAMSATRPMYWSVVRELWENRSIYIAPLVVAAVVLFASLVNSVRLPQKMRGLSALDATKQRSVVVMPYSMAASAIMLTGLIVGVFYCL